MTLSNEAPFVVLDLVPSGPTAAAVQGGALKIGDILEKINSQAISSLSVA
jgi:hypothetical protein